MQLRRIEVRDFRKLRHVVVADLQDGLNVVVGDNEANWASAAAVRHPPTASSAFAAMFAEAACALHRSPCRD